MRRFLLAVLAFVASTPLAAAPLPDWFMALTDGPDVPRTAPREHDLTIVEFFDYNCPYCKVVAAPIDRVVAADGHVRVVWRDWPVLGQASQVAARVALAAKWQGKYDAVRKALLARPGRFAEANLPDVLRTAGVDRARLYRDMVTHKAEIDGLLRETALAANRLGFAGTPVLIVGRRVVTGAVDEAELRRLIAQERVEAAKGAV